VRHVPGNGGVLLVCNHQSFLDPVIATCALHREGSYMARDTLFASGPFTQLIRYLNAFPVKRGMADLGAVKETLRRLRNGELITVFPEATRTPDGSILPMQPGAVAIARKAGVPIVPCLIDGAYKAWPRQQKFPLPGYIRVVYRPAILPSALRKLTDEEATLRIRSILIETQARLPDRS
jgi:1-acyl-sn-glycerol-3-phosphate acyltransferase